MSEKIIKYCPDCGEIVECDITLINPDNPEGFQAYECNQCRNLIELVDELVTKK